MRTSLREALSPLFPEGAVLQGFRIGENRRILSLKLTTSEKEHVAIVALDRDDVSPAGELRCDGLVVARRSASTKLHVIFVELKGTDTKHALKQINVSFDRFCSRQNMRRHNELTVAVGKKASHSEKATGLIVSQRGIPLVQERVKKLSKQGLSVKRCRKAEGLRLADLDALATWS